MPATKEVIAEALSPITVVLSMDDLLKNCYLDGIHISNHHARMISQKTEEVIAKGGFYNMSVHGEGKCTAFTFYNIEGDLVDVVVINAPEASKDRKIPRHSWVKQIFESIGYFPDALEIKFMWRLIESHIRDGGSWEASVNDTTIYFTFRMGDRVKARYEFHKEELT